MAETLQLSIVYRAEDRAFLRALKNELREAQKLDKVLSRLRQTARDSGGTAASGVSRLSRDYDKLSQSIRKADREAARLQRTMAMGGRGVAGRSAAATTAAMGPSGAMAFLGRAALPVGAGYAVWRMARAGVSQFAAEDEQLAYFRSLPGANAETARRAMRLGSKYPISRLDLAKGAYQAASSEVPLAFVDDFTKRAAILKTADPNASFEDVVKFTTDVMNAYKPTGILGYNDRDMKRFTDMVVRATQLGKLEIAPMSQSYGEAFQMGAMLKVAPEEILAMGTLMSNTGVQTPEQATAIKQLFNQILSPSDKAQEKARSMGIDLSGRTLQDKGLGALLAQIAGAAHKSKDDLTDLAELFPEVRSLKGMLAGYYQDPAKFKSLVGEYRNAEHGDVANKASQIASDNLVADWQKLKNTAGELNIILGEQTGHYSLLGAAVSGFTRSLENVGMFMAGWHDLWGEQVPQWLVDQGVIPGETTNQKQERERVEKYARKNGITTFEAEQRLNDPDVMEFERASFIQRQPAVATTVADPAGGGDIFTIPAAPKEEQGPGGTALESAAGVQQTAAQQQQTAAANLSAAAAALTRSALILSALKISATLFGGGGATSPSGSSGVRRLGRALTAAF